MKGVQVTAYGNPAEVVKLVDVPEIGAPGPDEIVIEVEAASIEPSDLYIIAGIYGVLPPLPHILGIQGVGRVSAAGRNVKYVKEGDRTLTPAFTGSWVQRVKTDAPWLRSLPKGDINQLAMLGINPATAYLLFTQFAGLKRGDWVLQNAANSGIGRSVIAIAKFRGLKTVNIVRRTELTKEIKAIGGDVVVLDGPDLPKRIAAATDNTPIKLALDGVGESATQDFVNSIDTFGTVVVWSAMSGKPFSVFGPTLLFHDQTIRGMWIYNWFKRLTPELITTMYAELAPLVASGALSFPVAGVYPLDQYQEAIAVASKYSGKVIFKP